MGCPLRRALSTCGTVCPSSQEGRCRRITRRTFSPGGHQHRVVRHAGLTGDAETRESTAERQQGLHAPADVEHARQTEYERV